MHRPLGATGCPRQASRHHTRALPHMPPSPLACWVIVPQAHKPSRWGRAPATGTRGRCDTFCWGNVDVYEEGACTHRDSLSVARRSPAPPTCEGWLCATRGPQGLGCTPPQVQSTPVALGCSRWWPAHPCRGFLASFCTPVASSGGRAPSLRDKCWRVSHVLPSHWSSTMQTQLLPNALALGKT